MKRKLFVAAGALLGLFLLGVAALFIFVDPDEYPSVFPENGVDLDAATVIYARDLGEKNVRLMMYYPERSYYLATRNGLRPLTAGEGD